MPEKYKGYLFEYEVVEVDARLGTATIRYTEKVIKPLGVQFESYKETPGVEQMMPYPLCDLDDSHESWQKSLGRVNAHTYEQNARLVKAQQVEVVDADVVDLTDIEALFNASGTGSHMLELEFVGDPGGSTYYQNKHGQQAQYWTWTHRLTGYKLRRFMNTGGRSFETGRLSAYLKDIRERDFPVAYARAQHILMLNKCKGFESAPPDVPITLERRELIAQQVSRLRLCFSFVVLYLDLTIAFVFSLLRSSWLYSQLKPTLLQPPCKEQWPSCS